MTLGQQAREKIALPLASSVLVLVGEGAENDAYQLSGMPGGYYDVSKLQEAEIKLCHLESCET